MIQIGCTKKLLDFLNMPSAPAAEEAGDLFGFSANLIVLNRRKCIAVVNNETCCGFLLYGITANDKTRLQELLEAGLRNMLASENFSQDVIDRYLADCSFPATFCKTANRSTVARLNHFCQRIGYYKSCFDPDDRFQTICLPMINDDIVYNGDNFLDSLDDEIFFACEKQEQLFRERYGKLYNCRCGVFDISLELETPCVRRVMIPMDFSLFYLHDVIQKLFLWSDCHLHEFVLMQSKSGCPLQIARMPSAEDDDFYGANGCTVLNEQTISLADIFPKNNHIIYKYDFGDGWTHEIQLIDIIDDADIPAPVCTEMNGGVPLEDCEDSKEVSAAVRILKNSNDFRHDDMVKLNGGSSSVLQMNIDWINAGLRRRYLAGAFRLHYVITERDDEEE